MTARRRYGLRSLRFKLVLASVVVEALMLTALVWNSTRIAGESIEELLQHRVEVLVPLLNVSLANPLAQRDYATLDERLGRIVRKESLVYIEVRDELGRIAASRGVLPTAPNLDRSIESARNVFGQEFDITVAGRVIGRARYGLNVSLLEATLASLRKQGVLVASAGIILSVLLLSTLGALLTRHLLMLAQAARALQGGDYSMRVPVVGRDEVADTAQAFNALADALARGVTDRKRAEAALRQSEQRLRNIIDGLGPSMFVGLLSTDGVVLEANQQALSAAGLKPEDVLGKPVEETYWFSYSEESRRQMRTAVTRAAQGEASRYDVQIRVAESQFIPLDFSVQPFRDAAGEVVLLVPSAIVITERKQAEDQLRERERRLSTLISNLPGVVFRVRNDANYTAEYVSDQIAALTGYPAEDFRENRRNFGELMHPDDRDWVWNETQKALGEHRPYEVSYRFIDAHGREKWNWERGRGNFDAHGELQAIEGFVQDITARKEAEQNLRESARQLETLSRRLLAAQEDERRRIARELHDELGQALTVIKINLQARDRLKDRAPAGLDAENIRIVEGALQQVRRLALALRPSMLDDLGLLPALRWMADQAAGHGDFTVHFGADIPETRLAPEVETACFRIAQEALTNIARHAQARRVAIELRREGDALVMTVRDDGCGFDTAAAFERARAGGSLGVLGMQERAALAGGQLEIESAPGQGTTVRARMPWRVADPNLEATE